MLTDSIANDLKHQFRYGGAVMKLIFINVAVFLAFAIIYFIGHFAHSQTVYEWLANQLMLHTSFSEIITKPWGLVTHMFTHLDPPHIIGNMIYLYFFGQIFVLYLGEKKVLPLYLFCGLFGSLLAILCLNFIPALNEGGGDRRMVGASGAVLGIIFAAVAVNPEHRVNLFFLGEVKIMYLAIVPLVIDILMIPYGNAGGYIAHLGGAIAGYNYIKLLQSGTNIFAPFGKIKALFSRKSKVKMSYKNENFQKPSSRNIEKSEQQRVDEILDKIARSGYDSLTKEEKDFLFHYSNK